MRAAERHWQSLTSAGPDPVRVWTFVKESQYLSVDTIALFVAGFSIVGEEQTNVTIQDNLPGLGLSSNLAQSLGTAELEARLSHSPGEKIDHNSADGAYDQSKDDIVLLETAYVLGHQSCQQRQHQQENTPASNGQQS